jgi:hypothetical protein
MHNSTPEEQPEQRMIKRAQLQHVTLANCAVLSGIAENRPNQDTLALKTEHSPDCGRKRPGEVG